MGEDLELVRFWDESLPIEGVEDNDSKQKGSPRHLFLLA